MSVTDHVDIVGVSSAQQLADGLTRMILDGALAPGERIRESAIARDLGLSRNTVREAVRLLQNSGLVRYGFNRGLVVWQPTDADVVDVFAARLHFEAAAAATLTAKSDLTDLENTYDAYLSVLQIGDTRRIVDGDLAIHQSLVRLIGSSRIDAYYSDLITELRYLLLVLTTDDSQQDVGALAEEHREIVDAFRSRQPKVAQKAITRINNHNRDAVRAVFAQRAARAGIDPTASV